jgi:hypothetical protein
MIEKPKAGEWWEKEGVRLRVIGEKRNGLTVGEHECGSIDLFRSQDGWQHLTECTGFDWQEPKPEVWPKYYRGKLWSDYDAFLEIHHTSDRGMIVRPSGKKELAPVDWDYAAALECVLRGSWKELTEAEAIARIARPQQGMVRVKLRKYVEPNGRGDFMFLREDTERKSNGYTPVNEWVEIEVPISKV